MDKGPIRLMSSALSQVVTVGPPISLDPPKDQKVTDQ